MKIDTSLVDVLANDLVSEWIYGLVKDLITIRINFDNKTKDDSRSSIKEIWLIWGQQKYSELK